MVNFYYDFIHWLNNKLGTKYPNDIVWEVGREVCFYRDNLHRFGSDGIRTVNQVLSPEKQFSEKRTFVGCGESGIRTPLNMCKSYLI